MSSTESKAYTILKKAFKGPETPKFKSWDPSDLEAVEAVQEDAWRVCIVRLGSVDSDTLSDLSFLELVGHGLALPMEIFHAHIVEAESWLAANALKYVTYCASTCQLVSCQVFFDDAHVPSAEEGLEASLSVIYHKALATSGGFAAADREQVLKQAANKARNADFAYDKSLELVRKSLTFTKAMFPSKVARAAILPCPDETKQAFLELPVGRISSLARVLRYQVPLEAFYKEVFKYLSPYFCAVYHTLAEAEGFPRKDLVTPHLVQGQAFDLKTDLPNLSPYIQELVKHIAVSGLLPTGHLPSQQLPETWAGKVLVGAFRKSSLYPFVWDGKPLYDTSVHGAFAMGANATEDTPFTTGINLPTSIYPLL